MKHFSIMLMALSFGVAQLQAGWVIDENKISIEASGRPGEGYATYGEAVKALADKGKVAALEGTTTLLPLGNADLQKELVAALERDSPREWKAALKSAGNMHNPKMEQLWDPFKKAVLATPTVQKMNAALAPYGLAFTGVEIEELELAKEKDGSRVFYAPVWLKVGKMHTGL